MIRPENMTHRSRANQSSLASELFSRLIFSAEEISGILKEISDTAIERGDVDVAPDDIRGALQRLGGVVWIGARVIQYLDETPADPDHPRPIPQDLKDLLDWLADPDGI